MKKGKHNTPGAVRRGKDIDNGIRFESKLKRRHSKRKLAKAGRRANRKGKR